MGVVQKFQTPQFTWPRRCWYIYIYIYILLQLETRSISIEGCLVVEDPDSGDSWLTKQARQRLEDLGHDITNCVLITRSTLQHEISRRSYSEVPGVVLHPGVVLDI